MIPQFFSEPFGNVPYQARILIHAQIHVKRFSCMDLQRVGLQPMATSTTDECADYLLDLTDLTFCV